VTPLELANFTWAACLLLALALPFVALLLVPLLQHPWIARGTACIGMLNAIGLVAVGAVDDHLTIRDRGGNSGRSGATLLAVGGQNARNKEAAQVYGG
jgi:hypothetical protein